MISFLYGAVWIFVVVEDIDFVLPSVKLQIVIKTLIAILLPTYSVYSLIFFFSSVFFFAMNIKICRKMHWNHINAHWAPRYVQFYVSFTNNYHPYHAMNVLFEITFPELVTLTASTYIFSNDQIKCWNLIAFNTVNRILLLMLMECAFYFSSSSSSIRFDTPIRENDLSPLAMQKNQVNHS